MTNKTEKAKGTDGKLSVFFRANASDIAYTKTKFRKLVMTGRNMMAAQVPANADELTPIVPISQRMAILVATGIAI